MSGSDAVRQVFIVGAGEFARELYGWIVSLPSSAPGLEIVGFADDRPVDLTPFGIDLPVCRPEEAPTRFPQAAFLLGVAAPAAKRALVGRLLALGIEACTWLHPSVLVGRQTQIGAGTVVSPGAILCSHAVIGPYCTINSLCEIGHDVRLGEYATLLGHNAVNGRVEIGPDCLIGSRAVFHPGIRIGRGATVGIGSVVLANVAEGVTVFGNPARKLSA